jgi:hypothetical protein
MIEDHQKRHCSREDENISLISHLFSRLNNPSEGGPIPESSLRRTCQRPKKMESMSIDFSGAAILDAEPVQSKPHAATDLDLSVVSFSGSDQSDGDSPADESTSSGESLDVEAEAADSGELTATTPNFEVSVVSLVDPLSDDDSSEDESSHRDCFDGLGCVSDSDSSGEITGLDSCTEEVKPPPQPKAPSENDQQTHGASTRRGGRRNQAMESPSTQEPASESSSRRGVLRTFTSDSLRGVNAFGLGKNKTKVTTPVLADSPDGGIERSKPAGATSRRGGRRNQDTEDTAMVERASNLPSRRSVMRTFTSDSLRGVNVFGFRKNKTSTNMAIGESLLQKNTAEDQIEPSRPTGTKTRQASKESPQAQQHLSKTPSRRGLMRTFTSDSLRGVNAFGLGTNKSQSQVESDTLDGNTDQIKPHAAKTRRGSRRIHGMESNEPPPMSRRSLMRTFTSDSLRGVNVFAFGAKKSDNNAIALESMTGVDIADGETERPKPHAAKSRRGSRRNDGAPSPVKNSPLQPPSRRSVMRTFTSDSLRGANLFGFGTSKHSDTSASDCSVDVGGCVTTGRRESKKVVSATTRTSRGGRRENPQREVCTSADGNLEASATSVGTENSSNHNSDSNVVTAMASGETE